MNGSNRRIGRNRRGNGGRPMLRIQGGGRKVGGVW